MKIKWLVAFALISNMVFPICAAENVSSRVMGQPVADVHEAGKPVASTPVAEKPVISFPATDHPAASVSVTGQLVANVPDSASAQPSQQAAINKSRLTFMDSKLFDARLGKELEPGKDTVEVDVSGRVLLSNIPERIDRWMVKSAEEGKVELLQSEPAPKTRFIFSLIPMVFNAIGFMKDAQEEKMFDQAKNYDTKIYYKKDETGETLIEKIVMTRRKP